MSVDHYENFPVASWLCPSAIRPAVRAIYGFARTADDIADEGPAPAAERLADLQAYRADLLAIFAGGTAGTRWQGVFAVLDRARRDQQLPLEPLSDLLSAFSQDVHNPGYASYEQLLDYCARSANPVGRLMLHLLQVRDGESLRQADDICTALQLINFWQDLSIDQPRGRDYLPQDVLREHGLDSPLPTGTSDEALAPVVRELCLRAHQQMWRGAPLARRVPGRAGWELRLVVQGGLRILEKIEAMQFQTLRQRPRLWASDVPRLVWRAWRRMP